MVVAAVVLVLLLLLLSLQKQIARGCVFLQSPNTFVCCVLFRLVPFLFSESKTLTSVGCSSWALLLWQF